MTFACDYVPGLLVPTNCTFSARRARLRGHPAERYAALGDISPPRQINNTVEAVTELAGACTKIVCRMRVTRSGPGGVFEPFTLPERSWSGCSMLNQENGFVRLWESAEGTPWRDPRQAFCFQLLNAHDGAAFGRSLALVSQGILCPPHATFLVLLA